VSALTIIRSRKFAVVKMISYWSRESRRNTTMVASDSAAETAGRRSTTSQKKLSRPQAKPNTSFGTMPTSVYRRRPNAARCSAAITVKPKPARGDAALDAAHRLLKNPKEGSMAGGPCPAMTLAAGTPTAVLKRDLICHFKFKQIPDGGQG